MAKKAILTVTDEALSQIKALIQKRGKPTKGIRIFIKTKGCSGLSYAIEYVDQPIPTDEIVSLDDGLNLYVDQNAILFLIGSEMDYQQDALKSGFLFNNPNEKGRCGCGESFHV